jgi:hypothetical protein
MPPPPQQQGRTQYRTWPITVANRSNLQSPNLYIWFLPNTEAKEAGQVASRWIGHTNGSARPRNKHFARRSFHLAKIKPSVHEFLQMSPKLSETYVFIPRFSKRSLNFTTIYWGAP